MRDLIILPNFFGLLVNSRTENTVGFCLISIKGFHHYYCSAENLVDRSNETFFEVISFYSDLFDHFFGPINHE